MGGMKHASILLALSLLSACGGGQHRVKPAEVVADLQALCAAPSARREPRVARLCDALDDLVASDGGAGAGGSN